MNTTNNQYLTYRRVNEVTLCNSAAKKMLIYEVVFGQICCIYEIQKRVCN